mmetsp:Transcript_137457/g.342898  ORF Transcript_137457/g.342898 Transcript_137457/m.342898 type:complete len:231 (-) Transcript_137457:89-781(-)|eukprot:CAMPEP_0115233518 /NCGR_PEP_ID=MMETSP0270-20121206/34319_1 /TAXON_ID=71861 /ORGANISM="Scrippsiella trochoidea, Strain CCMP3099" /LENGTH=230 /DNA_ID=CAMNT_0002648237 /DNA_START=101 /DNA_END=793 /DNA_ORIENTATION=-
MASCSVVCAFLFILTAGAGAEDPACGTANGDSCRDDGDEQALLGLRSATVKEHRAGGQEELPRIRSDNNRSLSLVKEGSSGPNEEMEPIFARHNYYRCIHGLSPLEWSDEIASNAQEWSKNGFQHSPDSYRQNVAGFYQLGENLFMGSGIDPVDFWYSEIQYTNDGLVTAATMNGNTVLHYTQIVWKATTTLGCGSTDTVLVCEYGPAGNWNNEWAENVNAPVKSEEECR